MFSFFLTGIPFELLKPTGSRFLLTSRTLRWAPVFAATAFCAAKLMFFSFLGARGDRVSLGKPSSRCAYNSRLCS
jgi:hypothetical protein